MKNLALAVTMVAITMVGYHWFNRFGLTGISMLYLLMVVGVAYYYTSLLSVIVAILSFLCINYFFVEPRFTLQVGHIASLTSLLSFLIVSVVISSLVKQLKIESFQSNQAYQRAELSRKLAELLAYTDDMQTMLSNCAQLLQKEFNKPVNIVYRSSDIPNRQGMTSDQKEAIVWAQANGKSVGPHTSNWPESDFWIVPFNRLPSDDPVVFVAQVSNSDDWRIFNTLQQMTQQIAIAYQHQIQKIKTLAAENHAQEEAIKGALLASISHDMRTPLTSILGAATTLNQPDITMSAQEMQRLTTVISSQAKHLARTTENILSLIRLESVSRDTILMGLQSPEEIMGVLADLYRNQTNAPELSVTVNQPDLLINANHDLMILALTNLIENAKQANIDNNRPQAIIEIAVCEADGKIDIKVCDQGKGFNAGFNASHIKKFDSSRDKGFGLGLSIVHTVAKLHQAELRFDTRLNEGENSGAVVSLRFAKPDIDLNDVG